MLEIYFWEIETAIEILIVPYKAIRAFCIIIDLKIGVAAQFLAKKELSNLLLTVCINEEDVTHLFKSTEYF